jgi:hypothetical protein
MATKSRTNKPASRAAARPAARKTTTIAKPGKNIAKPAARKALANTALTTTTRATPVLKTPESKTPAPKRPKQRIAINHLREGDFKTDGLRTYAAYRDLGIAEATHGLARAHVIRMLPPCNPIEVSKLHTHAVDFQMIYVLKGWVKSYLEGVGETLMKEGSCWTQPPRIKHMILDYSDDVELLEVILPADFKTVELTA